MIGRWCGLAPSHLSCGAAFTFIAHYGFVTQILAHMLDSLVRVSRRADDSHFVSILTAHGATDTRRARRVSVLNTARAGAPQAGPVRCIGCLSQRQRSNARL